MGFREFIKQAFSDDGQPSSSRLLTAATTASSIVALLSVVFKSGHLPDGMALTGLGAFASSPYAVNRASKMFGKDKDVDSIADVSVSDTVVLKKKE